MRRDPGAGRSADYARDVSPPVERSYRSSTVRRARLGARQLLAWRPSWSWAGGVLRAFVTSFLALTVTLWLLPGTQVTAGGATSVASLAVIALAIGALVRPLITRLTVVTGVVGLLLAGLLTQALVLWLALSLVPTVRPFGFGEVVLASWAAAVTAAAVNWLLDTSSDDVFLGQLLGRAVRHTPAAGALGPGLLVVQLDGVSEPVLRQAITSGAMPTISRWVRSGSHELRCWHTGLPATTPAGQAVLLHGDVGAVPGFRWYDKGRGRLMTLSKPADAAEVEAAFSDGSGLLAHGGASISNLFSGDAPARLLTLSDARLPGSDRGSASFASLRFGLLRSVLLFLGQVLTEWHQGRRQRRRDVVPRVRRGGSFVVLRGLTTVILRDLNVSMVAEQMTLGAPVVFVDFVDYDEVAHHAGPTRPESMRTLENLDRVLQFLDQVAGEVGRRYEIAVVSDHGQTQGATFLQRTGRTLEAVVHDLAGPCVDAPPAADGRDSPDESWIAANLLLAGARGSGRVVTRAARSVAGRGTRAEPAPPESPLLVAASGSLAHVYRTDLPGRLTREQLDRVHPALVRGLASQAGVGAVLTRRADGRLVVDGPAGCVVLEPGREQPTVVARDGEDPLAPYGPRAAADLLALDARQHVGDLVVLAAYDDALGEVVAFEELVGSHGGLGGWQTEAFLVSPRGWGLGRGVLTGPEVHEAMVGRLERLGLRRPAVPAPGAGEPAGVGGPG